MASLSNNNLYKREGLYGAPLPSGLTNMRYPENPRVVTPETAKKGIKDWNSLYPAENRSLLPSSI